MATRDRKKELVKIFNELLAIKDITYGELNTVIPYDDAADALRTLEKRYPDLGLARYGTGKEGISFLSLIATVTRVLVDDSLAFVLPKEVKTADEANDLVVKKVTWLSEN